MTRNFRTALLGAAMVLLQVGHAFAAPEIEWRVENPFRFFTSAASSDMHRATYLALSDEERRQPVLSAERALAERHNGEGWAGTVLDKTCWNPVRNRAECKASPDYINPKSHQIVAELKDLEETAAAAECTWLTAPRGGRGQARTVPC